AGGEAAEGEDGDGDRGEAEGGHDLSREYFAAAARSGQDRLPGAVAILGREQVAADDAGQDGEGPQGGESEDDERHREARLLHRAAEERVGWHAALDAHDSR